MLGLFFGTPQNINFVLLLLKEYLFVFKYDLFLRNCICYKLNIFKFITLSSYSL